VAARHRGVGVLIVQSDDGAIVDEVADLIRDGGEDPVLGTGRTFGGADGLRRALAESISAHQLASNRPALEIIRSAKAFSRSRYPTDLKQGCDALLPHLSKLKSSVCALGADAVLASMNRQNEEAVESLLTAGRVADSLTAEPLMISQLVRMTCWNLIVSRLELVLNSATLTDNDASLVAQKSVGLPGTQISDIPAIGGTGSVANEMPAPIAAPVTSSIRVSSIIKRSSLYPVVLAAPTFAPTLAETIASRPKTNLAAPQPSRTLVPKAVDAVLSSPLAAVLPAFWLISGSLTQM